MRQLVYFKNSVLWASIGGFLSSCRSLQFSREKIQLLQTFPICIHNKDRKMKIEELISWPYFLLLRATYLMLLYSWKGFEYRPCLLTVPVAMLLPFLEQWSFTLFGGESANETFL
jgi:hypothetical protein